MEREFREFHKRRAAESKRVRKEVERSRAAARNRQQQQHSAQHGGKKKRAPKTKVADENPTSCCHHPIACAIRLKAFDALGELLSFEFSPLGTLDRRLTRVQLLFTRNLSPLQSSKFSFEYLLLPPRSAPGPASPRLAPKAAPRAPRPPTRRRLALAPAAAHRWSA